MTTIRSSTRWILLVVVLMIAFIGMGFWPDSTADELPDMPDEVDFSYHIQPILSTNCYSCHGNDPSTRKAGLRLDQEDVAKSRLESGASAIVAGNLNRSELVKRILSQDPEVQMPPPEAKKSLTAREIALLKKWIKQGAEYQDHWAFIKPKMPSLSGSLGDNIPSGIDHLISERIKYKQLEKSSFAKPNELLRRTSYLLTGLPPTLGELEAFGKSEDKETYESMIQHYLTSAGFGERWARHWMDLVRYGESMGHEGDYNISNAYEYRDYLIRAFNADVPYDQLVKEHLAGDMLEMPRVDATTGLIESHLGTGYFFLGEGKHSPVDPKLEESDKIDNMIDVTSKTFQALTVACAKCHDHKFDPIPTTDYYAMYGMIESSRLGSMPAAVRVDQAEVIQDLKEVKQTMKDSIVAFINNSNSQEQKKVQIEKTKFGKLEGVKLLIDFENEGSENWYRDGASYEHKQEEGHFGFTDKKQIRVNDFVTNQPPWKKKDKKYEKRLAELNIEKATDNYISIQSGYVSSRATTTGLQGSIHSPNFIIEDDTIAIKARGLNGTIRLIIDNFQVIRNPLWGSCEIKVNSADWKTYKMDLHLAKGHKAYFAFFPGVYQNHVYDIKPDDFIEVKSAISYSDQLDIDKAFISEIKEIDLDITKVLQNWKTNDLTQEEALGLQSYFYGRSDIVIDEKLMDEYHELKSKLFSTRSFVGLTEGESITSSVFRKGSINNQTEEKVPHRFLSAVNIDNHKFPDHGSGRLAWAEALVHPDNPLTARVMVNRIWHHLFGKGLVETVDNFGLQGKIPSHPKLLDFLAIKFVEDNWSIKTLVKNILLSDTYKRSTLIPERNAENDPENIYLASYPVRRIEAEAIRDGILATTGCMDRQMYGKSVPVYLSKFMTGRGRPAESGPIDGFGRRSIYTAVRRNFIPEMMLTFDSPIPFSTFGRRNTTNVPAQSLTLMNDAFVHEQALHWAENLLNEHKDLSTHDKINLLYLKAFSRAATTEEKNQGSSFLEQQANKLNMTLEDALVDPELWKHYCHTILNLKEFIHLI